MGLNITFKRVKEHSCPNCGRVVFTETVMVDNSAGPYWYDFLEHIGYYIPPDKRPEDFDGEWYGKDMTLTVNQTLYLLKHFPHEAYNAHAVLEIVALAISHGDRVVINADW